MNRFLLTLIFLVFTACQSETALHQPDWGLYQIHWNPTEFCNKLKKQISLVQGTPDFVLFFRDLHPQRGFPTSSMGCLDNINAIPIISLELTQWNLPIQTPLKSIQEGQFDAFFTQWALDAKQYNKEVWLRFGFEMNGDWFPWGQKPEAFRKSWIRIHNIFQKIGATNVKWVFSPNVLYQKQTHYKDYYPGTNYVDYTALDGYNFGDHHDQWHQWQSYHDVFKSSITALKEFNKPMGIAEIGCADDARKPKWLQNFFQSVSQDPTIEFFIYFNYDKRSEKEPNWALDSDPQSLKVFQDYIKTKKH